MKTTSATTKITILVPSALLKQALSVTRTNITETTRRGLQMIAASKNYDKLRQFRGKISFSLDIDKIRSDDK